ncbi:type II secretion system protein [Virgibacillus halodenitrificans]|uniref:Type II secretion system protein n=2 Tax=Virgibacillus halodenitrificans TaxID=1482 RepID=A0ABR7VTY5_VIRHA|nr:type II secretion system protein [Virgibacillus halodenitrificans]
MYTKFKQMNSSGFTLIEIIAAITILGIVIAVMLPIFPQIFSWSNMTEDELSSSNLLGQVAHDIKELNIEQLPSCPSTKSLGEFGTYKASYELNNTTYTARVGVCQSENESALGLTRANIQIFQGGKKISESYTYITGEDS